LQDPAVDAIEFHGMFSVVGRYALMAELYHQEKGIL
jgi:hypothetical protein